MRKSNKKFFTILFLILLVLIGGQVIPRLTLMASSSPPTSLTTEEKGFFQAAMATAHDLTGNPIESAVQTGLQVKSLRQTSKATGCSMVGASTYSGHYKAIIHAYTWFGIPYAEINVDCDGATIRRSPLLLFVK